jgi:hypothetical protein
MMKHLRPVAADVAATVHSANDPFVRSRSEAVRA